MKKEGKLGGFVCACKRGLASHVYKLSDSGSVTNQSHNGTKPGGQSKVNYLRIVLGGTIFPNVYLSAGKLSRKSKCGAPC